MYKWLIVYNDGSQEVIEAEDLWGIHGWVDSDRVSCVVKLNCSENMGESHD